MKWQEALLKNQNLLIRCLIEEACRQRERFPLSDVSCEFKKIMDELGMRFDMTSRRHKDI